MKNSIIEKIKSNKKLQIIIIASFLVILVLMFVFSGTKTKDTDAILEETAYVTSLEKRLSETLSKVEGVGKVSVVITVESGMETVLASKVVEEERATGKVTETTPILVNGKTVVLKELYPKVTGVLIVCEGAKNISVLTRIQQATESLLNIDAKQIEILTMK